VEPSRLVLLRAGCQGQAHSGSMEELQLEAGCMAKPPEELRHAAEVRNRSAEEECMHCLGGAEHMHSLRRTMAEAHLA
jgi:hypothetical protein